MGIDRHHWVSIVGGISMRRRSATMAMNTHHSTICNRFRQSSILEIRAIVVCGCRWLMMGTLHVNCWRQQLSVDNFFWVIVQTMSIAVDIPTSIVQDNNHLLTTMSHHCDKQSLSPLLPGHLLFRTIAIYGQPCHSIVTAKVHCVHYRIPGIYSSLTISLDRQHCQAYCGQQCPLIHTFPGLL